MATVGTAGDVDGTVDRVRDPPKELLPVLYTIKAQCEAYNVDLHGVFQEAGGTGFGMMPTTRFCSALVVAMNRLDLDEQTLTALADAYGCGEAIPPHSRHYRVARFGSVAWKDFCEDVAKAEADQPYPYPYGGPPQLQKRKA